MEYLKSLNNEQKEAVLSTEGPVCIVAGAGAGKTKTVTYRIFHLIKKGVLPENILAITFTNKAAKEMKERVFSLMKENNLNLNTKPHISTFHSLGVSIIRQNHNALNVSKNFTIFDKTDQKKAVKDACVSIGLEPKEYVDKISHIISNEKNNGNDLSSYLEKTSSDYLSEATKNVWTLYEKVLQKEKALDFDDLLLKIVHLFKRNEDILEKYQNFYKYIHVDEYQDTNKIQNEIVELLARKLRNLCIVGDTDQNIYSWRGAQIKNMLHFERKYPEVKTFFLEQNYRSTKKILLVANKIIEKNSFRIPKKLFTENEDGGNIGLFQARNETDEAHFIALKSLDLINNGVSPNQIAVLYRANFQSRALEEACIGYNVPYQMIGTKFFERKEIKDVFAYIKASILGETTSDFVRAISVPPRGIGKTTIHKILNNEEGALPPSTKIKIKQFRELLSEFQKTLTTQKPSEAIKFIITQSGLDKMYDTKKEEDMERLENIMELVSLATHYDEMPPEDAINQFLTDGALVSDQDNIDETKEGIHLMTVHASKGLEFDYVFVCGLEADLFPHNRFNESKKSGEDSEEERRLFYVAVTRTKKKLFLTFAQTRTIFGTTQINAPSEFLEDIPEEYTEKESYGSQPLKSHKVLYSIDF
ncbi:MAG: UvrD-helicase domain-containing protein [Candidatus Paceibacterota bacterium]